MSWQLTKLSDFLNEREGRIKHEYANKLGLQRIKKIDFSGQIHLEFNTDTKTDMIRVCSGDLVISGINAAKGAIAVHQGEEDVLATIHYSAYEFNPDLISVDFLKWFFKSKEFATLLKNQVSGGIKTELKAKHILPLEIRIPSLAEQLAIAEKLNKFRFEKLRAEIEIKKQRSLVSNLRESIIQDALQGTLTKEWRQINKSRKTTSQLLMEISELKTSNVHNLKSNSKKLPSPINQIDVPFLIPESWVWCRLGDIIDGKPRNGLSLKPVDYVTPTKTLKLSATTSGDFDGSQCKYLNQAIESDSYLWLKDGDILIQRANSLDFVGTTAVYRGKDNEFIYPDLMMKCRAVKQEMTDFLHLVLNASFTKLYYKKNSTGAAGNMPKINQTTVIDTLIPVPPIDEQSEIMDKIQVIIDNLSKLHFELDKSERHLDLLSEAILKEVFVRAA